VRSQTRVETAAATELRDGPGYIIGPVPPSSEADWVRSFVEQKWRRTLAAKYPEFTDLLNATPIQAYHSLSDRIDHAATWVKDTRLFTADEVAQLKAHLSVFGYLSDMFGPYQIADIEHLGYPEVYWRLVRPNHPDDVSAVHADAWFYTLTNDMPEAEQRHIVKVWFPVFSEPGMSGLSMATGSQKMSLRYAGEHRHGRTKPVPDDPRIATLPLTALPLAAGQCVAFHVATLHKGLSHTSNQSRVSIEFAIRLDKPLSL
jgi:hypothetical protein